MGTPGADGCRCLDEEARAPSSPTLPPPSPLLPPLPHTHAHAPHPTPPHPVGRKVRTTTLFSVMRLDGGATPTTCVRATHSKTLH